jgi:hypothetical protein
VKQGEIFKNFRYSLRSDIKDKRTKRKVLLKIQDKTKSYEVVAIVGRVVVPVRHAAVARNVVPTAAAKNTILAGRCPLGIITRTLGIITRIIPIAATLPHISMHII